MTDEETAKGGGVMEPEYDCPDCEYHKTGVTTGPHSFIEHLEEVHEYDSTTAHYIIQHSTNEPTVDQGYIIFPPNEIPDDWEFNRGKYRHEYLHVEITVSWHAGDDAWEDKWDSPYSISILNAMKDGYGASEAFLDNTVSINKSPSVIEAANWALACMQEINNMLDQYSSNPVVDAMASLDGSDLSPEASPADDHEQAFKNEICPACGMSAHLFWGEGNYEIFKTHFGYFDDDLHDGWGVTLES